ncbi:MAG TPA: class I SAM-dependent methyltransferase, partial [Roseiflexaceae bacterium]|nr:class I SAM-dependent methyltransferase [Roseiflexaceae bacterium]
TSFEEWQPPAQPFDMLFSATAWHWIKPEIGYPKAARVLAPGGHIAIFTSHHPTPYTGFFAANAPILRSLAPELGDPSAPSALDDAKRAPVEWLARDGLFALVLERYYHWTRDYTSEQYIRLCNTYSSHINLQPERRERLHAALGELIDREFNGVVTRPYETALFLAKKR